MNSNDFIFNFLYTIDPNHYVYHFRKTLFSITVITITVIVIIVVNITVTVKAVTYIAVITIAVTVITTYEIFLKYKIQTLKKTHTF